MSASEQSLFVGTLRRSDNYLEFGAGGSTCIASGLVGGRIVTVDSSTEWLDKVVRWCAERGTVKPHAVFVDIGPRPRVGLAVRRDEPLQVAPLPR